MRKKYIYLISSPHSGSTILAYVLGMHPQIATVGEISCIPPNTNYKCSCSKNFQSCHFWKTVKAKLEIHGEHIDFTNLKISLPDNEERGWISDLYYYYFPYRWMDHLRDLLYLPSGKYKHQTLPKIQKLLRIAIAISDTMGKEIFLDTTKDPFRIKPLLMIPNLDVKVIFMIRDGRAVMNSLITKEKWSAERSIMSQLWARKNMERLMKHYLNPEQLFILRHEDLCLKTDETLSKLAKFIDTTADFDLSNFKSENFHIIGNQMRLTFNGEIRYEETWRKQLSPHHLSLFTKLAGEKINKKYGY
jgi:hypothetical protein